MPTYFTLQELLKSDTAKRKAIDNTPSFEVVDHLRELTGKILDPLRVAWGKPIRVSSGYRCPKLNAAVKGSATSVHMIGYAADLQTSGSFNKFRDFVVEWFRSTCTKFDQILLERDAKTGAQWIHVGLFDNNGRQRGIIKVMEV
ncbi:MAG: peptidase M15 [Bacteroidales bacterium]|nr:peptidase M15 [Bacteroidales bacterium]